MNENLLDISIFIVWFQEAIQNRRENSCFCLCKLHLSPRISLLNQVRVTILFLEQMLPKNMFKMPFRINKSSNIYHRIWHIVRYFLYSIPQINSFHPLPLTNLILTNTIQLEPCSWRRRVHFQPFLNMSPVVLKYKFEEQQ